MAYVGGKRRRNAKKTTFHLSVTERVNGDHLLLLLLPAVTCGRSLPIVHTRALYIKIISE